MPLGYSQLVNYSGSSLNLSGTSLGSGVRVLFSSNTSNLAFATLSSQTPSTLSIISSSTGVILFSASTSSSTGLTSGTSLGSGVRVLFSSNTSNLAFATLSSQTPSTLSIISSSTGVILFSARTDIGRYVSSVTSAGTGTILLLSSVTTGNTLVYKSISQGSGMAISDNGSGTVTFASVPVQGVIFNSLGNTSQSNVNSENTIISTTLRGGTSLSASTATTAPQQTAGRRYLFTANGTISTHSSAGNLIVRMKLGNIILASSSTVLHNNIPANTTFYIQSSFTIRTDGSSGTVQSRGIMGCTHGNFEANASNVIGIPPVTTSIDTRTAKTFDFTIQFGTASGNNAWSIGEASLQFLDI